MTVKSPSQNILVENVFCNWSGGCAMGSLGAGTNISDITYKNVYTWSSNQMCEYNNQAQVETEYPLTDTL